jgi:hypothetical protein
MYSSQTGGPRRVLGGKKAGVGLLTEASDSLQQTQDDYTRYRLHA